MCVGAPAGAFSEPKIAILCSFGTYNSSFFVLNTEFEDFLHSGPLAGHSGWRLWLDALAGHSSWRLWAGVGCSWLLTWLLEASGGSWP